jgi:hypothetical protein
MVTGDQHAIAVETSKRLGLGTNIMEGAELMGGAMDDRLASHVSAADAALAGSGRWEWAPHVDRLLGGQQELMGWAVTEAEGLCVGVGAGVGAHGGHGSLPMLQGVCCRPQACPVLSAGSMQNAHR